MLENIITPEDDIFTCKLLRLPEVLRIIPVSRATWWRGVKSGKFPKPVKITDYITAWRLEDVVALAKQLHG